MFPCNPYVHPLKFLFSNHSKGDRACFWARKFLATVLRASKPRVRLDLLGCGMQLICGTENEYKQEALDVLHIRPRSRLREAFLRLIHTYLATESGRSKTWTICYGQLFFVTVFVKRAPVKDNTASERIRNV